MSRIRHATETFVNNLIESVKKLITANTEQIGVLSSKVSINLPISVNGETIEARIRREISNGQLAGRYRYTSGNSSDAPILKHGIVYYEKTNQSSSTDITFHSDSGEIYTAVLNSSAGGYISGWKPIATTDKIDISLLNDWINVYENQVNLCATRSGGIITLTGCIQSANAKAYHTIGQLPVGFRPPKYVMPSVAVNGQNKKLIIRNDGTFAPNEAFEPNGLVQINVSFPVI